MAVQDTDQVQQAQRNAEAARHTMYAAADDKAKLEKAAKGRSRGRRQHGEHAGRAHGGGGRRQGRAGGQGPGFWGGLRSRA
ncbi:hypothetical protein OG402_38265 [Streptomyces anulatus]|uniref:hypothetical protein n=1 Tax=Streptomyces anulatus TaxID=1892 RepID=UPI00225750AC|nr:hypothetical protein [Streptomyces anulatus]MCX4523285.1 hypothetical protein [Streptomyces anulatus]MCX4606296.1 hypothetical protein [Streptomyces anulatus]